MEIPVIENMDGTGYVIVDGVMYIGKFVPGARNEGVRRSGTWHVEPAEALAAPPPENG